jgi:hypothetical protein
VLCPSLCVKGWKYKDYKSRLRPWFRKFKEVGGERGKKGGRERDRKTEREREREREKDSGVKGPPTTMQSRLQRKGT